MDAAAFVAEDAVVGEVELVGVAKARKASVQTMQYSSLRPAFDCGLGLGLTFVTGSIGDIASKTT